MTPRKLNGKTKTTSFSVCCKSRRTMRKLLRYHLYAVVSKSSLGMQTIYILVYKASGMCIGTCRDVPRLKKLYSIIRLNCLLAFERRPPFLPPTARPSDFWAPWNLYIFKGADLWPQQKSIRTARSLRSINKRSQKKTLTLWYPPGEQMLASQHHEETISYHLYLVLPKS